MQPAANAWRDVLAKSVLFFFGIALWYKGLSFYAYYLLPLAWTIDGGLARAGETVKEPLAIGMLLLCFVLALGILWSDHPDLGFKVWRRYFAFLVFIPYLGLLNKERLPWAISGALLGYFGALLIGLYHWLVMGVQGIPTLGMPYLHFSSMLGIGVILALYLTGTSKNKTGKALFWALALFLLFIQFNQNARGILVATLISSVFLVFFLYRKKLSRLFTFITILSFAASFSAYNSSSFEERLSQARQDIELLEQKNFNSSIGYRLALWDVGLHGIAEHLFAGHGTGAAARYFDKTVETYKGGIYRDLTEFHDTYHYHNDWIEIGMQLGLLGLVAYALLLWGWFQTLARRGHVALAAALVSFIFVCGLVDNLVFFRQIIFLLIVVTTIFISYKGIGNTSTRAFTSSHDM
ncbi:O-antigen ligase family protein [Nitrosospira multiformis]|uniref:O-antigen ligase family protein n=1 Tax=Nitrosospira multiformis TaxID=1231 RepID=UPI00089D142F|nr:O-antigen ligase family protein [Nitrosospira multiformis]SDZ85622.1 O-antigen ligase [Nitrosospira multiformis]